MFTFRKRGKNHDFAEANSKLIYLFAIIYGRFTFYKNEIQKLYLGITFVCTLELTSRTMYKVARKRTRNRASVIQTPLRLRPGSF